jgi:ABC-type nitrate/sulfonate/bicarbonate transport system ATPase subunit
MEYEKILEIKNLNKEFENKNGKIILFEDFNLNVKKDELVVLLGPSGCGKSTLLEMAAGFDNDYSGELLFEGEKVKGTSGDRAVVFQKDALFPWLNVYDNIAYGLRIRRMNEGNIKVKVMDVLEKVNLASYSDYFMEELSGGMKQRVALARVLVLEPGMLLMDEPFGALDSFTRLKIQELMVEIRKIYYPAIVFITHDIDEALLLADRIVMLNAGEKRKYMEIIPEFEGKCENLMDKSMDEKFNDYKREILEHYSNNNKNMI